MTEQHFLVTGGAGFIGSHLVDRLVRDEMGKVTVVDSLYRGSLTHLTGCEDRIHFLQEDIRDEAALRVAMTSADVVFHLAAQSNVLGAESDSHYAISTNVLGTNNVLRIARESGVRRVVFTSSREVYGDVASLPVAESAPLRPKNAYGASKVAGEAYCWSFQRAGLDIVVLRLANVYGPRDSNRVIPIFLHNCRMGEPLVVYGGSQITDFVWIEDVVDSLVRAAVLPPLPEPINVGSGVGISILALAELTLDLIRSDSSLQIVPARSLETCRFVADISRMGAHLGVTPSNRFAERLLELRDWYATRGYRPGLPQRVMGKPTCDAKPKGENEQLELNRLESTMS